MPSPDQLTSVISGFFNSGIIHKLMVYTGYILLGVFILTIFVLVYYGVQYKYKIIYPKLHYDTDNKHLQVMGFKKDRARLIKKKDGTRKTHFLFARKYTEPLRPEHIKYGNKVPLLRVNDDNTYTPFPSIDGGNQFEYINNEQKTWAVLELKETAKANQTEEAQKRILTYTIIAIVILMLAVLLGIFLTLKYTGNVADALKDVTPSLSQIAKGLGGTPPN